MLIKKLIIRTTKPKYHIIRTIDFNLQGLNLIVDNTSDLAADSGNSVGKTTAIKVIDLCLGARSVRTLYYDNDTRSENIEIKSFLSDNKVEAELILLDEKNSKSVSIVRQLFNRGKRIINDVEYTEDEFEEKLKGIIFNLNDSHPTLRQLMPKFVRVNDTTSDSMIKYLSHTSNDKYETIYLFLFRILRNDLLSEKDNLVNELTECQKKLKFYQKDGNILSLDILEQRKELIERDLNELKTKRKNLDYIETYKDELQKKRNLTTEINNMEEQIQLIEFDINLINKNLAKLNVERTNININEINYIYNEAKAYIGDLGKTFDEVVHFHNTMIQNRINFITSQLEVKTNTLQHNLICRDNLIEESKQMTLDLLDEGLLDELNTLNTKIDDLNFEKGKIIKSIEILIGAESEIKSLSNKVSEILDKLSPESIKDKIKVFNGYFSDYCEKMYGEKYLFVYNSNWKEKGQFPVAIDHFKGNVGTGKKKGVIVAFDLSYMRYAKEMGIDAPRFVIHDKLENTHINQLRTIFNLCQEIHGQYIIPILRERVDKLDIDLIEKSKVLELSSDNKFFKL